MDKSGKMSDTPITPDEDLINELRRSGSCNDENQNSFVGGDMENLINDGVPGYEITGVDGTDDEIGEEDCPKNTLNP